MKKLVLAILLLLITSANADLKLWYQMDSADDFTIGDGTGGSAVGRLYVYNDATSTVYAAMTATSGIVYDPNEEAVYTDGVNPCRIYGQQDPTEIFTSTTEYTFSLWAKADLDAVNGNGYAFYVKFSDGSKFKFDLSFQPTAGFCFSAPGGVGWQSNAYHIWDPDPAYASRYVDPETWNMYTATWNAETNYVATYVNGELMADYTYTDITEIPAAVTVTEYGFGDGYGWHGPGGWFKDFKIYDTALNVDEITWLPYYNSEPTNPFPKNNVTNVPVDLDQLTWTGGAFTTYQDVYFGQSYDAVQNADTTSPEYQGQTGYWSFDIGTLELMKSYYWRVDQLGESHELLTTGPVWQFTTVGSIMIEDFESYDNDGNDITDVWQDKIGWGDMVIRLNNDPCISPVNSMKFTYNVTFSPHYAIAARSFTPAQNWNQNGAKILKVNYHPGLTNMDLPTFVTIGDGTTDANVFVDVDVATQQWDQVNISLPEIAAAGVDLNSVSYMELGFGDGTHPGFGEQSMMNIDDIALYPSQCILSESNLQADISQDCKVNYDDLAYITQNWLEYPPPSESNLNNDTKIDFADYSILANEWLTQDLWP